MRKRTNLINSIVLSSQKVLSASGRAGRLRFMGKYIDHRIVARPEPDNTFWNDNTSRAKKCMLTYDTGSVFRGGFGEGGRSLSSLNV